MVQQKRFELSFTGKTVDVKFPKYRKFHATEDAAMAEMRRVYGVMGVECGGIIWSLI